MLNYYSILNYRMIATNTLLSEHLQFTTTSPFHKYQPISQRETIQIQSNSNINLYQSHLALTNICFQGGCQEDPVKKAKVGRIHGQQGIKKVGMKHFLMLNKQKANIKNSKQLNNTTLKTQLIDSQKQIKLTKYRQVPSQNLQNRSVQLDEELRVLLFKRRSSKSKEKDNNNSKYKRITTQLISQDTFNIKTTSVLSTCGNQTQREVQKPLASIQNDYLDQKIKKKEGNVFYKKLKSKLQHEMQKIEDKNNMNKQNLLIKGCQIFNPSRATQILHKSLTERPRPATAISRTGLQYRSVKSPSNDYRPKSSKSRVLQRKQFAYIIKQSNDDFMDKPRKQSKKRTYKSLRQKGSNDCLQPQNNKTLRHVTALHKQECISVSKGDIDRQKTKQKMLDVLIECENQAVDSMKISEGLRVFEQFTKQVNKQLQQRSKIIDSINFSDIQLNDFIQQ